jgi:hypothetical protein
MPHTLMTAITTSLVLLLQFPCANAETLSDIEAVNQGKTDCKGSCKLTGLKASEEGYELKRSDITITAITFQALNDKGQPITGTFNRILIGANDANDAKKTKAALKDIAAKGLSDFHKRGESLFMHLSIKKFAEQLKNFAASKPCCSGCVCMTENQGKPTSSASFTYMKGDYSVRFALTIDVKKAKFVVASGNCIKDEGA